MANLLVTSYVDEAIAQLRRLDLMRFPGKIPEQMRDLLVPPLQDWVGWKPVPSTVSDGDLNAIEHETNLTFPPPYRDFLKYLHFVELTGTAIEFERHTCHDWHETLRQVYFNSWPRDRILDVGLLPFGSEVLMDAGPVCFDTRARQADGDCPVVYWDHEWVGEKKETGLLFSSCAKMFECLKLVAKTDINFIYHDASDDRGLLSRKVELLRQFLAIDPDGAGGPARSYWTSWGVSTEEKKTKWRFW